MSTTKIYNKSRKKTMIKFSIKIIIFTFLKWMLQDSNNKCKINLEKKLNLESKRSLAESKKDLNSENEVIKMCISGELKFYKKRDVAKITLHLQKKEKDENDKKVEETNEEIEEKIIEMDDLNKKLDEFNDMLEELNDMIEDKLENDALDNIDIEQGYLIEITKKKNKICFNKKKLRKYLKKLKPEPIVSILFLPFVACILSMITFVTDDYQLYNITVLFLSLSLVLTSILVINTKENKKV
ncbi:Plasmodium exported protein, unknown function [Plasmodium gallinaceum]|uniref:Uncharacterized protein n=1 Tax=Plasmodium gallinaceum TaxID=5849 RepID=A0A1J1GQ25_PLAGA|nr:Plasmodium exported protein, unknown function [Plasmodium gallinaceum]CRG94544.1 Plasmodium exported protein, unknown function [Plasmodium gallinaceum]